MATRSTKKTTPAEKPAKKPRTTRTTRTSSQSSQPAPAPRQPRPVVRVGTWVTLLILALVVAAAVYMNRQAEETTDADATPTAEAQFLFSQDEFVTSVEVQPLDGETVKIERNESQAWELTKPDKVEADQGLSEAAASQILALRIIDELDNSKNPADFGLDEPDFVITIGFEGGKTSTLEVGDVTPSGNGYYVRTEDGKFYLMTLSGISALTNLATIPPYLNTPTPVPTATSTPLPTETPAPTSETSSTPEASPTP